jgi:hypothetical protein
MTDPRNIAHDKKVQHDKKHRDEEIAPGAHAAQPGKKPHALPEADPVAPGPDAPEQGEPDQR